VIAGSTLVLPVLASVADASPPALQACTASNVKIVEVPLGQRDGQVLQAFELRNVGPSTCGMEGYPSLTFFTANRLDVHVIVVHDATLYAHAPAKLLSIGPGSEVSFGLAYRDDVAAPNDEPTSCLVQSVLIQLPLAPTATGEFAYHDSFDVCRSANTVAVSPVEDHARPKVASPS
jgi:hypothetical protein